VIAPRTKTARLTIGALSRATGIPVETIRTWEMRYGFPVPERKPSGHRLYALSSLARLNRIAEALRRGHRAGQVVPATERELGRLLDSVPVAAPPDTAPIPTDAHDLLPAIRAFDRDALTRVLFAESARLGTLAFLDRRVAPLVEAVGAAWATGRLTVTHEHFLSERVGDVLRLLRAPLEERATGPLVALATLPGETHTLGLQMAALALAHGGCRLLVLGAEVPPAELVAAAAERRARAVALSVSTSSQGPASVRGVRALRRRLPRAVALLVGGRGAPEGIPGVIVARTLAAAEAWAGGASGRGAAAAP
jgi:methanogenic corrinoid protein MtbC1